MKLSAPNQTIWLIAIVLGIVGIIGGLGVVAIPYSFWLLTTGFVLLAVGTAFKGI